MPIQTIHLIHHSHTDLGYTDLPLTAMRYHIDYCRQALELAWQTRQRPLHERFCWTFEVLWPLLDFWHQATTQEKDRLAQLTAEGQLEAGAMPFHTSMMMTKPQWQALHRETEELWNVLKPVTIFQNDINGLPWGLIPLLADLGVRYVMMGPNPYAGAAPQQPPATFLWQGPDGRTLRTWLGLVYGIGHSFFHEIEWRRGPVGAWHDLWLHPPGKSDAFIPTPQAVSAAHPRLMAKLAADVSHYPHETLAIQMTNQWRMDNDPPLAHLPEFVACWNAQGLSPRLEMSTPSRFFQALEKELAASQPHRQESQSKEKKDKEQEVILEGGGRGGRGDWSDWWADGMAQMPAATSLTRRTMLRLSELPELAHRLKPSDPTWQAEADVAWRQASLHVEHTFGAYDSVPIPYGQRTVGHQYQTNNFAYQADESARVAVAKIVRSSDAHQPTASADRIDLLNPGKQPRSGWITLNAQAFRRPVNALIDPATGERYPLEISQLDVWTDASMPQKTPANPYALGIWGQVPWEGRAYVQDVSPQNIRQLKMANLNDLSPAIAAEDQGNIHDLSWHWSRQKETAGELTQLDIHGQPLFDMKAPFAAGTLIIERPQGFWARRNVMDHDAHRRQPHLALDLAKVVNLSAKATWYGARFVRQMEHRYARTIEQQWDFLPGGRIELTTRMELIECHEPFVIWLSLPLSEPNAELVYDSLGWPTVVGHDQMPNACGEYACVGQGVTIRSPRRSIAVGCVDSPVVTFDSLAMRSGRRAFTPSTAHLYPMLMSTYWDTNFPISQAGFVQWKQVIAVASPSASIDLAELQSELLAYPARPRD